MPFGLRNSTVILSLKTEENKDLNSEQRNIVLVFFKHFNSRTGSFRVIIETYREIKETNVNGQKFNTINVQCIINLYLLIWYL